jgi:hypothetical protein
MPGDIIDGLATAGAAGARERRFILLTMDWMAMAESSGGVGAGEGGTRVV